MAALLFVWPLDLLAADAVTPSEPSAAQAPEMAPAVGVAPPVTAAPVAAAATTTPANDLHETEGESDADSSNNDDTALPDQAELETPVAGDTGATELVYTGDLDDAELLRRFTSELETLGSVSVGVAEEGRVINGVQLQAGASVQVAVPEYGYATAETIAAVERVAEKLRAELVEPSPLRVSHIGKKSGGYIRGHFSHQSGRDVDFGFFYQAGVDPGHLTGRRESLMDVAKNWAFLKAVVTESDPQVILVDYRIQSLLKAYALSQGEDKTWVESLFAGPTAIVRHARRHRDHFHVRFYAPRAQELGRRVQPILAKRPDENLAIYRVKKGDTLGHIAARYGSSVSLIQKASGLRGTLLSIGRTLVVPLRGPCTRCPLPPPVVVPPRHLPPPVVAPATAATPSESTGVTMANAEQVAVEAQPDAAEAGSTRR